MGARLWSDGERLRRGSDGEDDLCPDGILSIETNSCLVRLLAELPGAVLELGGRRGGVGFGSFEETDGEWGAEVQKLILLEGQGLLWKLSWEEVAVSLCHLVLGHRWKLLCRLMNRPWSRQARWW